MRNEGAHDMQMISSNHWQSFLTDLVRRYQGQLVSLEVGEDLLVNNPPAGEVTLQGIEYDKHKGVSISTGSGTETKTYSVEEPDLVWAVHGEHGKLVAVEIIDKDGRNLIVRLEP